MGASLLICIKFFCMCAASPLSQCREKLASKQHLLKHFFWLTQHEQIWLSTGALSKTTHYDEEVAQRVQVERLSQHAGHVSQLEAHVGNQQEKLQQLIQERDSLAADLDAKAKSMKEAERVLINQQAKVAQQQKQAEDLAKASDKVNLMPKASHATTH